MDAVDASGRNEGPMSETRFTPGPWIAQKGAGWIVTRPHAVARREAALMVGMSPATSIVNSPSIARWFSDEEAESNARLIAASPLMYRDLALCVAALKIARSLLLEAGGGEMPTVNAAIAQAEETLAKAVSQ